MKDIEIEIQARVGSVSQLRAFLEQEGAFVSSERQIDEYFVPAHRNFIDARPVQEWLRLRKEEGSYFITYKKWHYDEEGIGTHADEYETRIESYEPVRKILEAIDCVPLIVVDKSRSKWMWGDYEVALDTVVGLGDFVEVEYKGSVVVDPKETTRKMVAFLKDQGCGKVEVNNSGYPYMLLFPEETNFIEMV